MTTAQAKNSLNKYINTVLLTIITLILSYGTVEIKNLRDEISDLRLKQSITNQNINNHMMGSIMWTDRIQALENGDHPATANRYTLEHAETDQAEIKIWVNSNFVRRR